MAPGTTGTATVNIYNVGGLPLDFNIAEAGFVTIIPPHGTGNTNNSGPSFTGGAAGSLATPDSLVVTPDIVASLAISDVLLIAQYLVGLRDGCFALTLGSPPQR